MNRTAAAVRVLPVVLVGLLPGACGDDPTTVDPHLDVEGFAIFEGTSEIYRYLLDDGMPPTLALTQGVHEVVFQLLDHDGDPIPEAGADEDEEHVLQITVGNPDILTWSPEPGTDPHDWVEFHGELNALGVGSTVMEVCVPHGGHCDLDATVPVTVTAP